MWPNGGGHCARVSGVHPCRWSACHWQEATFASGFSPAGLCLVSKYQDKNLFICEDIVFMYRLATDPLSPADQQEGHAYRGDLFTMYAQKLAACSREFIKRVSIIVFGNVPMVF